MGPLSLPSLIAGSSGLAAFILMHIDVAFMQRCVYLKATKSSLVNIVKFSGFFSLCYALAAVIPKSSVFFTNCAGVCKVVWVFNYLNLLLAAFNPQGHGGIDENIYAAGYTLEKANFPVMNNVVCCIICMGKRKFTPNKEWIHSCVYRVRIYLWGTIGTVIATQVLEDQSLLYSPEGKPKPGKVAIGLCNVLLLFIALPGIISLRRVIQPMVLPRHRDIAIARSVMFSIFFTWISGLQNLVLALSETHDDVTYAIIAVEMLIFQIFSHKNFVPMFTWKFSPSVFKSEEAMLDTLRRSGYNFLVPMDKMASTVLKSELKHDGDDTIEVDAEGSENML